MTGRRRLRRRHEVYQAKYGRLRRARWAARVGSAGAAGGGLEAGAVGSAVLRAGGKESW